MSRVKKLTPKVLKKIIREEKAKIRMNRKKTSNKSNTIEKGIDAITKIALMEVKELVKLKKLREKRRRLKKLLAKRVK